jgi:hypothetical protein
MLDCCKSDSRDRNNMSLQAPRTQYKYSFRQRSHIPIYPFTVAGSRKLSPVDNPITASKNR